MKTDPPAFLRFKNDAATLHEAAKIGAARRKIVGSRINAPELREAVLLIDAWLEKQAPEVLDYALARPQPRQLAS